MQGTVNRLTVWVLLLGPPIAVAAPHEIKVFTDELAGYGEHTLELHMNKALRGAPVTQGRRTPFQVMPEYSYGLRRNWEISFQLPGSWDRDRPRIDGSRVELQYVAPHDDDRGWYWGINMELANLATGGGPRTWSAELVPIIGLRANEWHFVANPGISRALNGSARKANFEPSAKVARSVAGGNFLGLEYYVEAGPIRRLLPNGKKSQVVYLAWDGKLGKSDINIGLGRGFAGATDRWVVKSVFEFAF